MKRFSLLWCGLIAVTSLSSGCAVCSHDSDYDYGLYGGSWVRQDPCRGRVGSAFYEAGAPVRSPEPEVIDTPTPVDEPRRYTPDEVTEPT